MKKSFWDTELGRRTWTALLTGSISQSEAARQPGAPGQSAISQRLIRHRLDHATKHIKDSNPQRRSEDRACPVCGMISKFENLSPEEKLRFRRLLNTERNE